MDRSSINGFTILEIFVAILIISVSAIVITFFTRNTAYNYSNSNHSEMAYSCGQEKLSDLKAAPLPISGSDNYIVENDTFTRVWTVPTIGTPRTVIIDVSWHIMGKSHTTKVYGVVK